MTVIYFNGKTYNNLDEMPADYRAAYEQMMSFMKDENHNGIPDMFEGDLVQKMMTMASTRVIVNGEEVQGLESMPPETRAKFEQAMAKLAQLGISVPGAPSKVSAQPASQATPSGPVFQQSPAFIQSSPSVITEEKGLRAGVVLGVLASLAVLILCALAGFLLFNY